jgi:integrase
MTKRANGDGDVYPRKNKDGQITSYRGAYFGADGRRHYVSGKTKTEARNALATARTNAAGGIPPSPANLTAEKYLNMWLTDSIEGRFSRATYDAAKRDIHFHIVPVLGRRKLKKLSRDDIRALYRIKRDEGHSNRTLEYIHTTLRWALKDAKNDGKIAHNPTDGVKPYKTLEGAAKESKALNPKQVATLLSKASGSRYEALYIVALHMGLRRGEILALRWDDLNLDAGTLSVKRSLDVDGTFKAPKNPASRRTLKLTVGALEALKAHRVRQNEARLVAGAGWEDHNLVFPNTIGKPMNAGNFYRRAFQPLLERAGLANKGFTFHSLRHTFATTLADKGIHPAAAQKMLGHSDVRMTLKIYTHTTDGMQDAAIDALENAFGGGPTAGAVNV